MNSPLSSRTSILVDRNFSFRTGVWTYIYICYSVLLEIIIRDRDPFIVRFRFQDFYSIVWNTEARVSRYSIRTSSPEVYANLSREGDVARRFHRVTVTSLSRKHADLRSMPRR